MRELQLDGLRGLAAIGIVFFHAHYSEKFDWMWAFVDLFFVLSGFLITRIIIQGLKTDSFSLRNFMIRRILRIWPVYYIVLAFCSLAVVINYLLRGQWEYTDGLLSAPLFLQYTHHYLAPGLNAGRDSFILWFHHSWSIAVEEQFYLLMPLLLMVLRRHLVAALILILALIPVAVLARYNGVFHWLLIYRMDALCIGVAIAFYWTWSRSNNFRLNKVVGLLMLLAVAGLIVGVYPLHESSSPFVFAFWLLGMNMLFGLGVIALLDEWFPWVNAALSSKVMLFLGAISYALYLAHVPVRGVLLYLVDAEFISDSNLMVQIAYFSASIFAAFLSKIIVEDRVEKWKHKFPVRLPS